MTVSIKPDRLSALLLGLAPRVDMSPGVPEVHGAATLHFAASPAPMLHLHVQLRLQKLLPLLWFLHAQQINN